MREDGDWWFLFQNDRILVRLDQDDQDRVTVPLLEAPNLPGLILAEARRIGRLEERDSFAAIIEGDPIPPEGMAFLELRQLFDRLDEESFRMALAAKHTVEWERTSQFCGCCGTKAEFREHLKGKECPHCRHLTFPRISPAVIVLVERGDKVLLARSARFTDKFYSVLAGFVEPGESLEETVHREIREEVGIEVGNISYFGSQPWPFPDSLMIAFTAAYKGGQIRIDGEEIIEAGWFAWNELPRIPGKISIARALVDWFVAKHSHHNP
jgi:NAD+ diphosphatase